MDKKNIYETKGQKKKIEILKIMNINRRIDVRVAIHNVSNETSFLLLPFTYSFIRSSIDYDNKWIFSRFPHENSIPTLWSCSVALLNILIMMM